MRLRQSEEVDLAMIPVDEQKDEDLTLLKVYRDYIPVNHISKRTITSAHR